MDAAIPKLKLLTTSNCQEMIVSNLGLSIDVQGLLILPSQLHVHDLHMMHACITLYRWWGNCERVACRHKLTYFTRMACIQPSIGTKLEIKNCHKQEN